ncbi:MAG TPA: hypothetical protein VFQ88_09580 [Nevskiaceae bacterium]|nr:hypothetical protein [Nevskiaceae bacterium]
MNRIVAAAVAVALAAGLPAAYAKTPTPPPVAPPAPTCPPLDVYSIVGVNLPHTTLAHAAQTLFNGTGWHVKVAPAGQHVHVSLHDVSGPLDQVLSSLVAHTTNPRHTVTDLVRRDQCLVTLAVAAPAAAPAATPIAVTDTGAASALVPSRSSTGLQPVPRGRYPVPGTPVSAEALQRQATTAHSAEVFGTDRGAAHAAALSPARTSVVAPVAPSAYTLQTGQTLSHALSAYVASKGWSLKWRITGSDFMLTAPLPIPAGDNVIQGVTYVLHAYQALGALLNVVPLFSTANNVAALLPASALTESERHQLGSPPTSAMKPSRP